MNCVNEAITKEIKGLNRELNYVEIKVAFLEDAEKIEGNLTDFQEEMLDQFQLRECEIHTKLSGLVYI